MSYSRTPTLKDEELDPSCFELEEEEEEEDNEVELSPEEIQKRYKEMAAKQGPRVSNPKAKNRKQE